MTDETYLPYHTNKVSIQPKAIDFIAQRALWPYRLYLFLKYAQQFVSLSGTPAYLSSPGDILRRLFSSPSKADGTPRAAIFLTESFCPATGQMELSRKPHTQKAHQATRELCA